MVELIENIIGEILPWFFKVGGWRVVGCFLAFAFCCSMMALNVRLTGHLLYRRPDYCSTMGQTGKHHEK